MSKLTTEKDLMIRFQQGEAMAFNTIYNRFFTSLRHFTHRLTCQKEYAGHITVETFAKLYRLCNNFENIANVKAFLYVTARNACYEYLALSHRKQMEQHSSPRPQIRPFRSDYEKDMDPVDIGQALTEAVNALPVFHRRVFRLAYQQGRKTAEIARDLQLTETAVRGYRRDSIRLLRIALFERQLPEAALSCLNLARLQAHGHAGVLSED